MRGAVTQLERWGIAPTIRANSPDIETVSFHYGTSGGATMAGLSVAWFFVVLVGTETIGALRRRGRPEPVDLTEHDHEHR